MLVCPCAVQLAAAPGTRIAAPQQQAAPQVAEAEAAGGGGGGIDDDLQARLDNLRKS